MNRKEFIEYIAKMVVATPSEFFNSVTIAQAALESGYGTSTLYKAFNNSFGYKAKKGEWNGKVAGDYKSDEEVNGVLIKDVPSDFRAYDSVLDSVKDHAYMMSRTAWYADYYKDAINAKTPEAQAKALTGKYAGDSKYDVKLMDVINAYGLKKYDGIKEDAKEETPVAQKRSFKDVAKQVYGTEVINWDGFKGIGAGNRGGSPKGAIIHNDYGRANGKGYISWLTSARIPNPSAGYAHYYHDRKYAVRAVPTTQGAWHAGDFARGNFTGHGKPANYGNMQLLGYEVNKSLSTTNQEFRLNEEVVFMQVAEDSLFYGWNIDRSTIYLHRQYTSTTCPHRSWDLHVGAGKANTAANRNSLVDYFIGRVKFWVDVLSRKRAVPAKNYLPETGQTPPVNTNPGNPAPAASPHNPQGLKETDLKP